jgi:ribosome-associated toxin RatA of RatAB toxin-antitoxin module
VTQQQLDHDSVQLHMDAPATTIYELVADVTRTPEFSPEIAECVWLDGATGPAVGARFKARNKMPNRPTFSN